MLETNVTRLLRTPHSERFLLRRSQKDVAVVDIHFLLDNTVHATMIVFEDSSIADDEIPEILTWIDEVLLPQVSVAENKLQFTVVRGRVVGAFLPTNDANP
jgi:hypothetical protein